MSEFPDHARTHSAAVNTASSMTKGEIAELTDLAFAAGTVG